MTVVPGGDYELKGWDSPGNAKAALDDFYIDKFEVSNREFKEFIDAGGYVQKRFWKHQFLSKGRILDCEQAAKEFRDRTGMAAPRIGMAGCIPRAEAATP